MGQSPGTSTQGVSPTVSSQCRYQRPKVAGKFLYLGNKKFFVQGVTYGAFPPNSEGHQFPEPTDVAQDFSLMQKAGINSILTYTVPPLSLLDQAQEYGIRVIVNIPWMEYVCFLDHSNSRREIRRQVKEAVACAGGPSSPASTLDRLTKRLGVRGCAVGWNAEWEDWDLKVRRGALGEARLQMVVEHHGGPRRLARLSATIRPPQPLYWLQGALLVSALAMGALGLYLPLAILGAFCATLWVAPIREANRLEAAVQSAADDVVWELCPDTEEEKGER